MKDHEIKSLKTWLEKMERKLTDEISSKSYLLKLVQREYEQIKQIEKSKMTVKEEKKG